MGLSANQQQSQHGTSVPSGQQLAAYQIAARLLLGRYLQGPDTFAAFRERGGQARPYPMTPIAQGELGFIDPNGVDPTLRQYLSLTQPQGGNSGVMPGIAPGSIPNPYGNLDNHLSGRAATNNNILMALLQSGVGSRVPQNIR